mmetsp:Transcript_36721/g.70797  ORF Transcript_36721/g.70797 Transcript_36721/m.70797 type:complete len:330 (-) Transcript_36721:245-1234(-)
METETKMDKLDMALGDIVKSNPKGGTRKAPSRMQRGRNARRGGTPYSKSGGTVEGNSVFVGNLNWNVRWQELKDHMGTVGEVEFADVLTRPDGKSSGGGIVRYKYAKDAQRAIDELTDTDLNGRPIFVREDREKGKSYGGGGRGGSRGGGARGGGTTVFVGNLDWKVSWQDLKDHMKQAGEIEYADVITRSDGKSSGGGLVRYTSAAAAQKAIRTLTDTEINGRLIFVREDREGGIIGGGRGGGGGRSYGNEVSVYVGNIPWHTQWQTIKDKFADYGVLHVDVGQERNGRMRGWAILKFSSDKDAAAAIEDMNGADLEGRQIEVRYDGK